MSQDTTSPNMNDEKRAALADAAWALLATHNIDQIELEMVADMAGMLQDAFKNAPLEDLVKVMPMLEGLVSAAKSNDPSLQTVEVEVKEEIETVEDENSEPVVGEEDAMEDGSMKDEEEVVEEKEESFEDSQKFIDAVNDAVAKKLKTVEKAKDFLPETFNFVDSSVSEIMHAAVKEETGETFEDSQIEVAFKMLKKQPSNYQNFGDSGEKDAWAEIDNKEI